MTLPPALFRDIEYRKALAISGIVDHKRIEQCLHAYDLQRRGYRAKTETCATCGHDKDQHMRGFCKHCTCDSYVERMIGGTEIIALANGRKLRTVQEWAQVGEFITRHEPNTTHYSRISSAVRYIGVIKPKQLVELIEDIDEYPTVEDLQTALQQIAFGTVEHTPILITKAIRRAMMGGSKLLSLNGDLPPEIRGDIMAGVESFAKALETMKGLSDESNN